MTFEELGVDQIFVDESDLYKNLGFVSKMNRIAGLPNTESNRALDMYMKTGYLRSATAEAASCLPPARRSRNTMAEMYTLQRYLAPETARKPQASSILTPGRPISARPSRRWNSRPTAPATGCTRGLRNSSICRNCSRCSARFADVQTADMLKLPRPEIEGGKPHVVAAPASPELKEFVGTLVDRAQKTQERRRGPARRQHAQDHRRRQESRARHAPGRRRCRVRCRHQNLPRHQPAFTSTWEATKDKRSTQLVFCDLSTPHPDRFNVYDEIRDRLIAKGIPAKEIAYIHDADTDAQKKMLFDAVNAGRVRILLGSTEKMGAGTNVQKRLKALHHLDAPWRPRDIEQREGRILRQGNENDTVDIYRYVTEGSFDAYMWQTLETKARFIQQVMNGSVTVRQAEDLEGGALRWRRASPELSRLLSIPRECSTTGATCAAFPSSRRGARCASTRMR